ncbi:hypothetical protein NPIL_265061, partial [Nephila pilipes]
NTSEYDQGSDQHIWMGRVLQPTYFPDISPSDYQIALTLHNHQHEKHFQCQDVN